MSMLNQPHYGCISIKIHWVLLNPVMYWYFEVSKTVDVFLRI